MRSSPSRFSYLNTARPSLPNIYCPSPGIGGMPSDSDRMVDESLDVTEDDLSGPIIDRRTTMKLVGAVGITGLAGCAGGNGTDTSPSGGGDGDGDGDGGGDGDGDGGGDSTPTASEKRGGRLRAGWFVSQLGQMDPHFTNLTQMTWLLGNIFGGLVEVGYDLSIRGDLAEDWTVEQGGKSIVFDLRQGIEFHNGTPFTAADVKYSLNRVRNSNSPHKSKLSSLDGVAVEDDHRVRLNFSEAFAPIMMFLTPAVGKAGAIVNQEAIEDGGKEEYKVNPVGTGPFQVAKHDLGRVLKLDAYGKYHKTDENGVQLPYLDGVDVKPISEAATRVNAIKVGDIDLLDWVVKKQANQIKQASGVSLASAPRTDFGGFALNNTVEPFTSKKVRLAVAKAIDRERYVETRFFGYGTPDTSVYSPTVSWVYRDEFGSAPDQKPEDQRYAPDEAKQLVQEAGATDAEITIKSPPPGMRGAKVVRTMLEETLGWKVTIDKLDYSTLFDRLKNGDFQMVPWGVSVAPDPDLAVYGTFGPPEEGTGNYWGYAPDDLMQLMEKQRTQLDREARKETLWKIEDRLIKDAPWAFTDHEKGLSAVRDRVKNYTHISLIKRFRDVWVEE